MADLTILKKALDGIERGFRGPKGQQKHVLVSPKAIAAACEAVADGDRDAVVIALLQGAHGAQERDIALQADDVFHLLAKAGG